MRIETAEAPGLNSTIAESFPSRPATTVEGFPHCGESNPNLEKFTS
jgi:hypothetical protein